MKKALAGLGMLMLVGSVTAADLSTTQSVTFLPNVPNAFACPIGICADFGNGYDGAANAGKTFQDYYMFSFTPNPYNGQASSTVQAFWIPPFGAGAPDVAFTGFSLWRDNGVVGVADAGDVKISSGPGTFVGATAYTDALLSAGNYYIEIDGVTNATPGNNNHGGYFGHAQITAVPEPSEWALMLSGLGLMGFMARRRRNASQAV